MDKVPCKDSAANQFHPEKRQLRKRLRAARKANRNNVKSTGMRSK